MEIEEREDVQDVVQGKKPDLDVFGTVDLGCDGVIDLKERDDVPVGRLPSCKFKVSSERVEVVRHER